MYSVTTEPTSNNKKIISIQIHSSMNNYIYVLFNVIILEHFYSQNHQKWTIYVI